MNRKNIRTLIEAGIQKECRTPWLDHRKEILPLSLNRSAFNTIQRPIMNLWRTISESIR